MAADANAERVVQDARLIMQTVQEEAAEGRRPYISDIRRLVERSLALRYAEYVQFLEKYGFLTLDRRSNLLALTKAGEAAASGDGARLRGLAGDARYHFGDRLPTAAAPAPARRRGERLDQRFLKLDRIGGGGLATVYAGRLLSVDRPVAIKLMEGVRELFRPDQQEEIRRRLELAVRDHARLASPFIVQLLDQNPQHDPPYYVMELAPGGDLRRLLNQGALPASVAVRCFVQIALGLQAAHAQGVLHRDLKPENVLLDVNGNVKLTDFGITRVVEQDGGRMRQAYVGYGSVGYMAPEVFRPGHGAGPQADLYALGIMLYEMLVGELPGRRSPLPSEVVDGVPTALDAIFDKMTQDAAERRFATIDAVLEAVWASDEILALFDHREGPWFLEAAVALPGLPGQAGDALADADEAPEPLTDDSPPPAQPSAPQPMPRASAAEPAGAAAAADSMAAEPAPAEPAPAEPAPAEPAPAEPAPAEPTPAEPAAADAEPRSGGEGPASAPPAAAEPVHAPLISPSPEPDGAPADGPESLDTDPPSAIEPEAEQPAPESATAMYAPASPEALFSPSDSLLDGGHDPDDTAVKRVPTPAPVIAQLIPAGPPPAEAAAIPAVVGVPGADEDPASSLSDVEVLDDDLLEVFEESEGHDPRGRTAVNRLGEGASSEKRRALEEKLRRLKKP